MTDAVYMMPCKPGSVFVNFGSECLNDCRFCVSRFGEFFGYDLSGSISNEDVRKGLERISKIGYSPAEVVICGIGEPFLRYDDVIDSCQKIREYFGDAPIRADTTGLWWGNNKNMSFLDCINSLSVSLNAESEKKYNEICLPMVPGAYGILHDFLGTLSEEKRTREASKSHFPDVRLTVVDTTNAEFLPSRKPAYPPGECPAPDIKLCHDIADILGFPLVVKTLFRDVNEDCLDAKVNEETLLRGEYIEKCKDCTHKHI